MALSLQALIVGVLLSMIYDYIRNKNFINQVDHQVGMLAKIPFYINLRLSVSRYLADGNFCFEYSC